MITIVSGPPGSGKTTHVMENKKPGDLVVDMDMIKMGITGDDWYETNDNIVQFACAARDAIIRRLKSNRVDAWIVTAEPDPQKVTQLSLELLANIVVLDVDSDECLRRITADERRAKSKTDWRQLVLTWWLHRGTVRL